jgi:hypothetical protein
MKSFIPITPHSSENINREVLNDVGIGDGVTETISINLFENEKLKL